MAEWVWKGGLDSAIGLLRLVFDTAALRRQQLGYTGALMSALSVLESIKSRVIFTLDA